MAGFTIKIANENENESGENGPDLGDSCLGLRKLYPEGAPNLAEGFPGKKEWFFGDRAWKVLPTTFPTTESYWIERPKLGHTNLGVNGQLIADFSIQLEADFEKLCPTEKHGRLTQRYHAMGYRVAVACIVDLIKDYDDVKILISGRSFMEYLSEFLAFRGKSIKFYVTRISPSDVFFIKEFFSVNSSIEVDVELFGQNPQSVFQPFDAVVGGLNTGGLIEYGFPQHREAPICFYAYVTKRPTHNMFFSHTIGIVVSPSSNQKEQLETNPNPQVVSSDVIGSMELMFGTEAPPTIGSDASVMLTSDCPCDGYGFLLEGTDSIFVSPTRCETIANHRSVVKAPSEFQRMLLYLKTGVGHWLFAGTAGFVMGGRLLPIPPGICLTSSSHRFARCEVVEPKHLLLYPAMLNGPFIHVPPDLVMNDVQCSCAGSIFRFDAGYGRMGISVNTCGCREVVYSDPVQGGAVQFERHGSVKEFPYQMLLYETNAYPCPIKTLSLCPSIRSDYRLGFKKLSSVPAISAVGELIVIINRHSFDQLMTMSLSNDLVSKEVGRLSLLARLEYQRADLMGVLDCNESIRVFCAEYYEYRQECFPAERRSFISDVTGIYAVFGNARTRKKFIAFRDDNLASGKWSVAPLDLISGQG